MPYNETTKKSGYIDIRFRFNETTEEWTDDEGNLLESYTSHEISSVERTKLKGITADDADALGESFFQLDSYQIFFATEVPSVVSDGGTQKFRG